MKRFWTVFLTVFLCCSFTGCLVDNADEKVVVYVSHDQDYSQPILEDFERETGIKVLALYDTEATKTTGLVNRIIAEKDRPNADVFWNNEVSRTVVLKNMGILEPYCSPNAQGVPENQKDPECYWTGFAARARVLIYNTDLVDADEVPDSLLDLKDERWAGKVCVANPLFGSTASHVAAVFAYLGEEDAKAYFNDLKKNEVRIVESNGMVRDMVVSGECYIGLTDTDDANDALIEGKPVAVVFPDQDGMGTLVFPNTVMLLSDSPNIVNGRKLVDFLLNKEVEEKLAASKAAQIPLKEDVSLPAGFPYSGKIVSMQVSHEDINNNLELSQSFMQEAFIG